MLTGIDALAALDRVVSRHGFDTIYKERALAAGVPLNLHTSGNPRCVYTYNGAPMCLVGTVLIEEFGYSITDIEPHEGHSAGELIEALNMDIDGSFSEVMNSAQGSQDNGHSWWDAVEYARKDFRDFHPNGPEEDN